MIVKNEANANAKKETEGKEGEEPNGGRNGNEEKRVKRRENVNARNPNQSAKFLIRKRSRTRFRVRWSRCIDAGARLLSMRRMCGCVRTDDCQTNTNTIYIEHRLTTGVFTLSPGNMI